MVRRQTVKLNPASLARIAHFVEVFKTERPNLIGIHNAFAASLTPAELLEALRRVILEPHARHVVLHAIDRHPDSRKVEQLSTIFVAELLGRERSNYREAQAINVCLYRLFNRIDDASQTKVVKLWLSDRYADSKKKFIAVARRRQDLREVEAVFEYWRRTEDKSAIKYLVYHAPVEWLHEHIEPLLERSLEPWLISRLLLRLADRDKNIIERVRTSDPITYLYLCAKTNRRLSNPDAMKLFLSGVADTDRRGLALWAIGRLGLWDVLQELSSRAECILADDERRFRSQYRVCDN